MVQDTFVSLWDKRERLESIKSVKAYLYTAVRNNCLTRLRDANPPRLLISSHPKHSYQKRSR